MPALEVLVVPGLESNPDLLRYTYSVANMTDQTMTLKLGFEDPIQISALDIDSLKIIFNDPVYFNGAQGETIGEGTEISKQIPPQMRNPAQFGNLITSAVETLTDKRETTMQSMRRFFCAWGQASM